VRGEGEGVRGELAPIATILTLLRSTFCAFVEWRSKELSRYSTASLERKTWKETRKNMERDKGRAGQEEGAAPQLRV